MPDLREQLEQCLRGRVCLMGLGNEERGDDGFGVRLAEALGGARMATSPMHRSFPETADGDLHSPSVVVAGLEPEHFIGSVADEEFDHVIFMDAVDFGGAPGSAVLLDSKHMVSRFPQVSTHKISLGTLAAWSEMNGRTKAWLLGVQPASLQPSNSLTPSIQATFNILVEMLGRTPGPTRSTETRNPKPAIA
jgi:hydrogenase 3 maturation protease